MSETVRAKFMCSSVELHSAQPYTTKRYKFTAIYDPTVPEDKRYAESTPSGQLTIRIDNPAVNFTPGAYYYLDFTPVDAA